MNNHELLEKLNSDNKDLSFLKGKAFQMSLGIKIGILFWACFPILALIMMLVTDKQSQLLYSAKVDTKAQVTEISKRVDTTKTAHYHFTDLNGNIVRDSAFLYKHDPFSQNYKVGDEINITYLKKDPQIFINKDEGSYAGDMIGMLIMPLIMLLGLGGFIFSARFRQSQAIKQISMGKPLIGKVKFIKETESVAIWGSHKLIAEGSDGADYTINLFNKWYLNNFKIGDEVVFVTNGKKAYAPVEFLY